jgi:hypothetical protein
LFELLDSLPLLLFETEQRVDVLLQILLLGSGHGHGSKKE